MSSQLPCMHDYWFLKIRHFTFRMLAILEEIQTLSSQLKLIQSLMLWWLSIIYYTRLSQQLYAVTVSWSTVYTAHWMSVLCSSLSRRSNPNIPSALCRYVVCWSTMSPARWWTHGECIRQCLCTSLAVENVVLWNVRRWQKATRLIYG